ncbi:MAG: substrate-binding domain-containing protein [Kiritimatiellales bacterium]
MKIDKTSNVPSFFQVVEFIEKKFICNPAYTEAALPSIEEMAALFKVSKVTVEAAINFLNEAGLLTSKVGRGTFIIPPNSRKTSKTLQNLYLVSIDPSFNPQNSFFHKRLSEELSAITNKRGLNFEYRYIPETHRYKNFVDLQRLVRAPGNGFIFLGSNPDYQSLPESLEQQQRPYIHFGQLESSDWPCLRTPFSKGTFVHSMNLAMQHLFDLGHRNIVLFAFKDTSDIPHTRINTYRTFMGKHVPDCPPDILFKSDWEPDIQAGWRLLTERLRKDRNFTAIVTLNDRLAAGAIIALKDAKIRVPEDVSVLGHDDERGLVDDFVPTISSIGDGFAAMADNAARRLIDDLPPRPVEMTLHQRESTGYCRSALKAE